MNAPLPHSGPLPPGAETAPGVCGPGISQLLGEFLTPQYVSVPEMLTKHNISPQQLLAWAKRPETREAIEAIDEINALRAAAARSHAVPEALATLLQIQREYAELSRNSYGVTIPAAQTESARKAASQLLTCLDDPPPLPSASDGRGRERATGLASSTTPSTPVSDSAPCEPRASASGRSDSSPAAPRRGRGGERATGFASSPTTPSPDASPPPSPAELRGGRGRERATGFASPSSPPLPTSESPPSSSAFPSESPPKPSAFDQLDQLISRLRTNTTPPLLILLIAILTLSLSPSVTDAQHTTPHTLPNGRVSPFPVLAFFSTPSSPSCSSCSLHVFTPAPATHTAASHAKTSADAPPAAADTGTRSHHAPAARTPPRHPVHT